MPAAPDQIGAVQRRLAMLRQHERELRIQCSQSQASLADTEALEAELIAVAEEIADFEAVLVPVAIGKTA